MRIRVAILLAILLFPIHFMSCNYSKTEEKYLSSTKKDTANNLTIDSTKIKKKPPDDTTSVISNKQIIGIWETTAKELLTLDITKNLITYKEHHESHKYKINGDSIYIYFHDLIISGRPYLINDTLVISTTNGELKYTCKK